MWLWNALEKVKSIADYDNEAIKAQENKLALAQRQQDLQLGMMKADEYKRGLEDQAALRSVVSGFGPDRAANTQALLKASFLKEAKAYEKEGADVDKTMADTKKTELESEAKRLDYISRAFGALRLNPTIEEAIRTIDGLASSKFIPPEAAAQAKVRVSQATPEQIREMATKKFLEGLDAIHQLPKINTVDAGGKKVTQVTDVLGESAPKTIGEIAVTNTPHQTQQELIAREQIARQTAADAARLNMERRRLSQSERQHAETLAAPVTVTDLTTGKEILASWDKKKGTFVPVDQRFGPKASSKNKAEDAPVISTDVLQNMRDQYTILDNAEAIPSTERGAIANILASARSSGPGQLAGQWIGTKEQSARTEIAQSRPLLVLAVAQALGMKSKSIDSNADMKLWLSTATDPTKDVQSQRAALDRIEQVIKSKKLPGGNTPSADGLPDMDAIDAAIARKNQGKK